MSGRSDEEIARDVLSSATINRRNINSVPCVALVAAGRAEGDKQGERRGWIEALTWVLDASHGGQIAIGGPHHRLLNRIRARLREITEGSTDAEAE